MGMSKAMMERIMVSKARMRRLNETILCATRYGNVMASRGSVIPLFVNQIKNGDKITITDSNMTRFLMSLDDSVNLVLHAFENANQGDIFVQKAPASTIEDLAEALKEIFNSNSKLKLLELDMVKNYMNLFYQEKRWQKAENMENYYRVPMDARDLNYNKFFDEGMTQTSSLDDYTSHNTTRLSVPEVVELLKKLPYIENV